MIRFGSSEMKNEKSTIISISAQPLVHGPPKHDVYTNTQTVDKEQIVLFNSISF